MSDSETLGAACELHQKSKLLEQMSLQRTKAGLKMDLIRAIRAYDMSGGDQEQLRDDIEKHGRRIDSRHIESM